MDIKVLKHNTPSATLVKNYQNKKSGKVSVSRKEIQRRFYGMDWKYQKQILLAFINDCASDRDWACRKMLVCWDKSFIPVVKTLWEQHHEICLSWLILQYFPKDYIKQNMDSLSKGRNYFYLCRRLIDEEDFHIDKNRLSELDLLELYKMLKEPVSDEAITEVFFSMIGKICRNKYKSSSMYEWDDTAYANGELSILSNKKVNDVLFNIEYFPFGRKMLAKKIKMWNSKLLKTVKESEEYRIIKRIEEEGTNAQQLYVELLKNYCLQHLDLKDIETEEEKEYLPNRINGKKADSDARHNLAVDLNGLTQQEYEKLKAQNRSFRDLVSKLGLVPADDI